MKIVILFFALLASITASAFPSEKGSILACHAKGSADSFTFQISTMERSSEDPSSITYLGADLDTGNQLSVVLNTETNTAILSVGNGPSVYECQDASMSFLKTASPTCNENWSYDPNFPGTRALCNDSGYAPICHPTGKYGGLTCVCCP